MTTSQSRIDLWPMMIKFNMFSVPSWFIITIWSNLVYRNFQFARHVNQSVNSRPSGRIIYNKRPCVGDIYILKCVFVRKYCTQWAVSQSKSVFVYASFSPCKYENMKTFCRVAPQCFQNIIIILFHFTRWLLLLIGWEHGEATFAVFYGTQMIATIYFHYYCVAQIIIKYLRNECECEMIFSCQSTFTYPCTGTHMYSEQFVLYFVFLIEILVVGVVERRIEIGATSSKNKEEIFSVSLYSNQVFLRVNGCVQCEFDPFVVSLNKLLTRDCFTLSVLFACEWEWEWEKSRRRMCNERR